MVFYHGREVINTGEDKRISRAGLSANPAKPVGSMFTERPCLKKNEVVERNRGRYPTLTSDLCICLCIHICIHHSHMVSPDITKGALEQKSLWAEDLSKHIPSPSSPSAPHCEGPVLTILYRPLSLLPMHFYIPYAAMEYVSLFSIACSNMRVEATINTI